jgi:hypothetical protein
MSDEAQDMQLLQRRAGAESQTMRYHRTQEVTLVSIPHVAWRGPHAPSSHAWEPSAGRIVK